MIGLNNELNGLSLGGIGRGTDIDHVEIMNNVDDGIEIWGGTVNIKNFAIWNVGDDSFDIDQGWRGKAQFGLIVQGLQPRRERRARASATTASRLDGAEDSDWQPVTTATIYNCTVIGQPKSTATTPRPGATTRASSTATASSWTWARSSSSFDNVDGDGGNGYGFNGTLSWAGHLDDGLHVYLDTSTHRRTPANVLQGPDLDGKLAEIKDSVFYNNVRQRRPTPRPTARGVFDCREQQRPASPASSADRVHRAETRRW